jgi:hypothetical protein
LNSPLLFLIGFAGIGFLASSLSEEFDESEESEGVLSLLLAGFAFCECDSSSEDEESSSESLSSDPESELLCD